MKRSDNAQYRRYTTKTITLNVYFTRKIWRVFWALKNLCAADTHHWNLEPSHNLSLCVPFLIVDIRGVHCTDEHGERKPTSSPTSSINGDFSRKPLLTVWLPGRLTAWPPDRVTAWPAVWSPGCLAAWMAPDPRRKSHKTCKLEALPIT